VPAADPLLIFDIGDTLISGPGRGPARRIGDACGLDRGRRRELHHALMTVDFGDPAAVADWMRRRLGVDGAEPVVTEVWLAQEREAEPVDGALAALQRLRAEGFRLALLSNIWAPYLTAARRHFGAFFDAHIPADLQVFSYRLGAAKPDLRGFDVLLRNAAVPTDRCVMIGDAYDLDIEPAGRLGLRTIWSLGTQERGHPMRAVDGAAPPPTRAVGTVAEVDAAVIATVLAAGR
jgi:HAD superfamily hydrolase (TIGR01509 family)